MVRLHPGSEPGQPPGREVLLTYFALSRLTVYSVCPKGTRHTTLPARQSRQNTGVVALSQTWDFRRLLRDTRKDLRPGMKSRAEPVLPEL